MKLSDFVQHVPHSQLYVLVGEPLLHRYVLEILVEKNPERSLQKVSLENLQVGVFQTKLILGWTEIAEVKRHTLPTKLNFPLVVFADRTTLHDNPSEHLSVVEDSFPRDRTDRRALLAGALHLQRTPVPPEVLRLLVDRLQNGEDFLNALSLVRCLPAEDLLTQLTSLIPPRPLALEKLVLHHQIPELLMELQKASPLAFLTRLHRILHRIYFWLEGKTQNENQIAQLLGIPYQDMGLWRSLERVYTPKKVREVLEEVAESYKQARSGDTRTWIPRLYNVLTQFGAKNVSR